MDPHIFSSSLNANHIPWLNHFFHEIFQKLVSENIAKDCKFMFLELIEVP